MSSDWGTLPLLPSASSQSDALGEDSAPQLSNVPLHEVLPRRKPPSVADYVKKGHSTHQRSARSYSKSNTNSSSKKRFTSRRTSKSAPTQGTETTRTARRQQHNDDPRYDSESTSLPPLNRELGAKIAVERHRRSRPRIRNQKSNSEQTLQKLLLLNGANPGIHCLWQNDERKHHHHGTNLALLANQELEYAHRIENRAPEDDFSQISRPRARQWLSNRNNNDKSHSEFKLSYDPTVMCKQLRSSAEMFEHIHGAKAVFEKHPSKFGASKKLNPYFTEAQYRDEARQLRDALAYVYHKLPAFTASSAHAQTSIANHKVVMSSRGRSSSRHHSSKHASKKRSPSPARSPRSPRSPISGRRSPLANSSSRSRRASKSPSPRPKGTSLSTESQSKGLGGDQQTANRPNRHASTDAPASGQQVPVMSAQVRQAAKASLLRKQSEKALLQNKKGGEAAGTEAGTLMNVSLNAEDVGASRDQAINNSNSSDSNEDDMSAYGDDFEDEDDDDYGDDDFD